MNAETRNWYAWEAFGIALWYLTRDIRKAAEYLAASRELAGGGDDRLSPNAERVVFMIGVRR